LRPEQWGSPLVQEKYREEKACDKRHPYRIIIIRGEGMCNPQTSAALPPSPPNTTINSEGVYFEGNNEQ